MTEHEAGGGLLSIASLPAQCGGGRVGMTPLLHFLYKSAARAQAIMPAFDAPLDGVKLQQVSCTASCLPSSAMAAKAVMRYACHSSATTAEAAKDVVCYDCLPLPGMQNLEHVPVITQRRVTKKVTIMQTMTHTGLVCDLLQHSQIQSQALGH